MAAFKNSWERVRALPLGDFRIARGAEGWL